MFFLNLVSAALFIATCLPPLSLGQAGSQIDILAIKQSGTNDDGSNRNDTVAIPWRQFVGVYREMAERGDGESRSPSTQPRPEHQPGYGQHHDRERQQQGGQGRNAEEEGSPRKEEAEQQLLQEQDDGGVEIKPLPTRNEYLQQQDAGINEHQRSEGGGAAHAIPSVRLLQPSASSMGRKGAGPQGPNQQQQREQQPFEPHGAQEEHHRPKPQENGESLQGPHHYQAEQGKFSSKEGSQLQPKDLQPTSPSISRQGAGPHGSHHQQQQHHEHEQQPLELRVGEEQHHRAKLLENGESQQGRQQDGQRKEQEEFNLEEGGQSPPIAFQPTSSSMGRKGAGPQGSHHQQHQQQQQQQQREQRPLELHHGGEEEHHRPKPQQTGESQLHHEGQKKGRGEFQGGQLPPKDFRPASSLGRPAASASLQQKPQQPHQQQQQGEVAAVVMTSGSSFQPASSMHETGGAGQRQPKQQHLISGQGEGAVVKPGINCQPIGQTSGSGQQQQLLQQQQFVSRQGEGAVATETICPPASSIGKTSGAGQGSPAVSGDVQSYLSSLAVASALGVQAGNDRLQQASKLGTASQPVVVQGYQPTSSSSTGGSVASGGMGAQLSSAQVVPSSSGQVFRSTAISGSSAAGSVPVYQIAPASGTHAVLYQTFYPSSASLQNLGSRYQSTSSGTAPAVQSRSADYSSSGVYYVISQQQPGAYYVPVYQTAYPNYIPVTTLAPPVQRSHEAGQSVREGGETAVGSVKEFFTGIGK